jgi:hypothetical protein
VFLGCAFALFLINFAITSKKEKKEEANNNTMA